MAAPMCRRTFAHFSRSCLPVMTVNNQNRQYARGGLRRNIVNVLTPEEEERKLEKLKTKRGPRVGNEINEQQLQLGTTFRSPARNVVQQFKTEKKQGNCKLSTKTDDSSFKFEKLFESDKRFGPVVMNAKSRKYREKHEEILLEGTRLIMDAIEAGADLKMLFFSRREVMEGLPVQDWAVPVYKVQHHHLKLWSDMVNPAGIMGVFRMPKPGEISFAREDTIPLSLVCDNVRDPGNMGTIIRAAAAAGCQRILVNKGCVDIWEPKVLRSAAGCHFRVPIINNLSWESILSYFTSETRVFLADVGHMPHMEHSGRKISDTDLQEILEKAETTNRFRHVVGESDHGKEDEDSKSDDEHAENLDNKTTKLYTKLKLPSSVHYGVDYSGTDLVLIVGSESTGPTAQAKKVTFDNYGQTVVVPMAANVDSLNTAIAASIIMFEIKRQVKTSTQL